MMNTNTSDFALMRRCFDLARLSKNKVKTNPQVGAVVIIDDKVISEGYHRQFGEGHAEVNAIKPIAHMNLKHATIYVSLEPCSHHGKTPPCSELIVDHKFGHCTIHQIDPNPVVSGNGLSTLAKGGVGIGKMQNALIDQLGETILRPFRVNQRFQRPYIILKWAQSRDGYLGHTNTRTNISNPLTNRLVHKWRSEAGAIMVGSQTVLVDNPHLGNRLYYGPDPVRVVVDRRQRIKESANIFSGNIPTLYYSRTKRSFQSKNVISTEMPADWGISEVLKDLYQRHIGILLVEGGAQLLQHFISENLWDETRVIINPKVLHEGQRAPEIPEGTPEQIQIGEDMVCMIRR